LELITTNYNVIDILGSKRADVYTELNAKLSEELALYGVDFVSITILDMDAGEKLEAAITEEAVAKKAVETAEQNLLKAETEAKQKSVQAKAEQEAAIIESETELIEAEAEKKANELLNQSLSEDILQKQWIDKWDGEMPTYYGDSDNLMIGLN
jgi:regulator of protease activity HflC (stomatin/prohibitin superfamily)